MSLLSRKEEFWKRFEDSIIEVINLAIEIFNRKDNLPENEDDLNRSFYFCLVDANYRLQKENRGQSSAPFYEASNQPKINDIIRSAREFKRPDFQWSITDVHESNPQMSSKQFILECKRLGTAKGTWVFNENYAYHGVKRFVSEDHSYALGVESSAMLGYIQSMEVFDVLSEVNVNVDLLKQSAIKPISQNGTTYYLSHKLKLDYSTQDFRLEHIWLDLRKFYLST